MELVIALQGAVAAVVLAAILAFFGWVAVSIMNLKAAVAGLRGDFGRDLAKMEARLLAAIYGRIPPTETEDDQGTDS